MLETTSGMKPQLKSSLQKSARPNKEGLSGRLKTDMDNNPENIEQYIVILSQHQKLFEKNGKFMEAEHAKKKALQLKEEMETRFLEDMKKDHAKQKEEISGAHQQEMRSFNDVRQERMREYKAEVKRKEEEMLRNHQQDLEHYELDLQKTHSLKTKESPEIINLRKILEMLAKQENYAEAHRVQLKIQALEKEENPKFATDRTKKINNLMAQMRLKQEVEMRALKQKLKLGFEEKVKCFDNEGNTLSQKYENTKTELEYNHKLQLRKYDKERKLRKDKVVMSKSQTFSWK